MFQNIKKNGIIIKVKNMNELFNTYNEFLNRINELWRSL